MVRSTPNCCCELRSAANCRQYQKLTRAVLFEHLVGAGELTGYRFVWRQADGPARKPGHIEITRQSHLLIDKNRAQPLDARCRTQRARIDRWCLAFRHRFSDHPPNQFSLVWNLETENEREG